MSFLAESHFGPEPGRISIRFYNGFKVTDGHIVRQTGVRRYVASDGEAEYVVSLARTLVGVTGLASLGLLEMTNARLPDGNATILVDTPMGVQNAHRIEPEFVTTVQGYRWNWCKQNSKYDFADLRLIQAVNNIDEE